MSWLWLAAAVAFSPSLVELAQHALALPRDRISFVLAALLLVRFSLTTTRGARDARAGVALLGVAVLLQFFGILGDALTLGRASVAVAVIALSRITGRPAATGAILALWLVPIPISVLEPVRGPLENAAADAVAAFCGLLGSPALAVGPMVRVADSSLELRVSDAGLHLAHVLSLLGISMCGVLAVLLNLVLPREPEHS